MYPGDGFLPMRTVPIVSVQGVSTVFLHRVLLEKYLGVAESTPRTVN